MPSRIWGPLIVMAVFSLAGGIIGADVAWWPAGQANSLVLPVAFGLIAGFLIGVLVVWYVREVEGPR
jgi:hypothetical protein